MKFNLFHFNLIVSAFLIVLTIPTLIPSKLTYPNYIKTPMDLSNWMINNLTYQEDGVDDHFKSPEKTIKDKGGDCEDFAILACDVLKQRGFKCKVYTMSYVDGGHAIAVFKDVNGKLGYFDNQYYIRSQYTGIRELLTNEYPEWIIAFKMIGKSTYFSRFYKNS